MKRIFTSIAVSVVASFLLISCGDPPTEADKQRQHEKEMARMQSRDADRQRNHERQRSQISPSRYTPEYVPIEPGTYTNYVGNTSYGSWDSADNGRWRWNDPDSSYARQTRSYYNSTGRGSLNDVTQTRWRSNHTNGWSASANRHVVKSYMDKNGGAISRDEYNRRKREIENGRQKWQARQASKRQTQSTARSSQAPSQTGKPAVSQTNRQITKQSGTAKNYTSLKKSTSTGSQVKRKSTYQSVKKSGSSSYTSKKKKTNTTTGR